MPPAPSTRAISGTTLKFADGVLTVTRVVKIAKFIFTACCTEPFPSWLCFVELKCVGGLGGLTGAHGG
jgi:hypothetical protein